MKIICDRCGKPTWKGCGQHIDQALKDVPVDKQCKCAKNSCQSKANRMKNINNTTTMKHK